MAETLVCCVCALPVAPEREAWCGNCGRAYHLNQRTDQEEADCGLVWINEEHLALEFACNVCLNPEPTASLDDVLDIEEAAALAHVDTGELEAAASSGAIRHRRTGTGVHLFIRRDVVAFRDSHAP